MGFLNRASAPDVTPSYQRIPNVEPYMEIPPDYLPDNVTVHFHFAPHMSGEHFESAVPILEEADIFIPECAGWNSMARRELLSVSRGDERKYRLARGNQLEQGDDYYVSMLDAIYRRGKYLDFIDVKEDQASEPEFKFKLSRGADSVEEALEDIADTLSGIAFESGLVRDRIMVRNLGEVVPRIVRNNRSLLRKGNVLALCTLGSNHMPLYEFLRTQDHTKDKVVATQWIGDGSSSPIDIVQRLYTRGEAPNRAQLLEVLAVYALTLTTLSSDGQSILPMMPKAPRQLNDRDKFGLQVLESIKTDITSEKSQQFLLNMLNHNYDRRTLRYLSRHLRRAAQLVEQKPH